MKSFLLCILYIYQHTLSPDHGVLRGRFPHGFCRYYPSCSEYAKQSIVRYGSLRGSWLAFLRVVRCNPFAIPRVDLP